MVYSFYIDGWLLPITPSENTYSFENQNKVYNTIDGSQKNIINPPGLTEWAINFDLPLKDNLPHAIYLNGFISASEFSIRLS